jgi:hypothetical protein
MIHFFIYTISSLLSGDGLGWTTKAERDEFEQAMTDAGKTGFGESDPGAWARHVESLQQSQPKEWQCPDKDIFDSFQ